MDKGAVKASNGNTSKSGVVSATGWTTPLRQHRSCSVITVGGGASSLIANQFILASIASSSALAYRSGAKLCQNGGRRAANPLMRPSPPTNYARWLALLGDGSIRQGTATATAAAPSVVTSPLSDSYSSATSILTIWIAVLPIHYRCGRYCLAQSMQRYGDHRRSYPPTSCAFTTHLHRATSGYSPQQRWASPAVSVCEGIA